MLNLNTTDLSNLSVEDIKNLAKQELSEYKAVRENTNLSNNINRVKNLDTLEKRLQGHSMNDSEALSIRSEIKDLLNVDVYKKTTDKRKTLSNYEVMQNYYNNFR